MKLTLKDLTIIVDTLQSSQAIINHNQTFFNYSKLEREQVLGKLLDEMGSFNLEIKESK